MYAKSNVLRSEDLGTALRSVGRRLTADQVKALTNDAIATHQGNIDFGAFQEYLKQSADIQKSFEDILAAFKVFEAKDKPGFIRIDEFTHALTTLGDKLSRQEVWLSPSPIPIAFTITIYTPTSIPIPIPTTPHTSHYLFLAIGATYHHWSKVGWI